MKPKITDTLVKTSWSRIFDKRIGQEGLPSTSIIQHHIKFRSRRTQAQLTIKSPFSGLTTPTTNQRGCAARPPSATMVELFTWVKQLIALPHLTEKSSEGNITGASRSGDTAMTFGVYLAYVSQERPMKRIWKFLRYVWDVWIPHRDDLGPGVRFGARSANEADNKILDDWMEEYKGCMTPEAFEEYRRRVLESVGGKRLRPHTSRQD